MFNNLSTMLNSLDSIAQENLEEPKISATSLRQQKKEAAGSSSNLPSLDNTVSDHIDVSGDNSEASFVVVDEHDHHSENTISPKSTISSSSLTEYVTAPLSQSEKQSQDPQSLSIPQANSTASLTSKSSVMPTDRETRQIIMSKNKEIEKLNSECLELESQNEGLKQEVREAWEAYKLSQEKAALREADYQEDMSQLERAKSSDREGMTLHVQNMESELEAKRKEALSIRAEHERVLTLLHSLQKESKEWTSKMSILESNLEVAQANNNQSLEGLREELRSKDIYIETLQSEHSNVMRTAHQRHDDLEQANSDLTSSLMAKERELTRLSQQQHQGSLGNRDSLLESEFSKLQMQLEHASGSLMEEKEQHQNCLKRLRASEQENDINKTSWNDEKNILLTRISEISNEQNVKPSGRDIDNLNNGNEKYEDEIKRLEEQLHTLGRQLLRKQENLEEYLSERAAIKVRLHDAERRCQKYEEQISSLLQSQDPYDYESSVGMPEGVRRSESGSLRKRGTSSAAKPPLSGRGRASHDLEKLGVHASPGVTKAVDMIDTWTLITGRHLKAYPLLRLSFVFYLLFIHIWAFCLLAYHAHSLDLENENANMLTRSKLGSG